MGGVAPPGLPVAMLRRNGILAIRAQAAAEHEWAGFPLRAAMQWEDGDRTPNEKNGEGERFRLAIYWTEVGAHDVRA